jgi:hypothetical protein
MSIRPFKIIVLLLLWNGVVPTHSALADGLPAPHRLVAKEIPTRLYHWTKPQSLRSLAPDFGSDLIHLKTIHPDSPLAKYYPALASAPGLFTWSDPVTGFGASITQPYGRADRDTGDPARLLALEINPEKVRAIEIHSRSEYMGAKGPLNKPELDLKSVDLIKHVSYRGGKVFLQEWIIVNPGVVEGFTADPELLRPLLSQELIYLRDPTFLFDEAVIHSKTLPVNDMEFRRNTLIPALEAELTTNAWYGIPARFLRKSRPLACGALFLSTP